MTIYDKAVAARDAAIYLGAMESVKKDKALENIKKMLWENKEDIFAANEKDIKLAKEENLETPLIKRLKLDEEKLKGLIQGIDSLLGLEDPVGKIQMQTELDTDLVLTRIACPIGVIGVIFESRPDALVQISTLCLKSGNAALLKGGAEAKQTNEVLGEIIARASEEVGMPKGWMALVENREEVNAMLSMDKQIDLLIPRGSNAFVSYIMKNTNIPVLGHADGICHSYVDRAADIDLAVKVVVDSKSQYVSVCNALETLLVHEDVAKDFLPKLYEAITKAGVKLKGCEKTKGIIDVEEATEEDWKTEYLDYILSIKVVGSLEEAIKHINTYGSGHTDAIITTDEKAMNTFMALVDSGNVFVNASTRFSDGFRYGFGAEVGVSTTKIHSRGPVGLEGLLIYKYKLIGKGHIVGDYASGVKQFTHRKLI
jgi:glutamate-5-semialdehyde dehydrogenase